jgi:ATP-dependent Lhr-like helicase
MEVFGVSPAEAEDAAEALAEAGELVRSAAPGATAGGAPAPDIVVRPGRTVTGADFFCDRENMDLLLRLSRKKSRPFIRERPPSLIAPFLALRQSLVSRASTPSGAEASSSFRPGTEKPWEILACCSAPAKLWETEFFTARSAQYNPDSLDREISTSAVLWYGDGKERTGFCAPEDLELVLPAAEGKVQKRGPADKDGMPDPRFFDRPRSFWEIKDNLRPGGETGQNVFPDSRRTTDFIWREAWQGRLSSDSFEPVRRGLEFGFAAGDLDSLKAPPSPEPYIPGRSRRIPRALRDKWKTGAPVCGNWFSLVPEDDFSAAPGSPSAAASTEYPGASDPLEEEALNRDRVRLLLRRYGVLCRPLLEHESASFLWARLLPTMRRMELAGELISGRFFSGIRSLQFAAADIESGLQAAEALSELYWINAADPASPAGLDIEGIDPRIGARTANSRLYFRGSGIIAVSNRNEKEFVIFAAPGDPALPGLIELFKIPRLRTCRPVKNIRIEIINDKPAAQSEFSFLFESAGFVSDRKKLCYWG